MIKLREKYTGKIAEVVEDKGGFLVVRIGDSNWTILKETLSRYYEIINE